MNSSFVPSCILGPYCTRLKHAMAKLGLNQEGSRRAS
jgi:hypothetical protein